jgi:lipid-binding SYLF domain-containing protein
MLCSCIYAHIERNNSNFSRVGLVKDSSIPTELLSRAKGLAFLTVVKGGFIFSGSLGTGLVIARQQQQHSPLLSTRHHNTSNNSVNSSTSKNSTTSNTQTASLEWSAPSAIATIGAGWGALIGIILCVYVCVYTVCFEYVDTMCVLCVASTLSRIKLVCLA